MPVGTPAWQAKRLLHGAPQSARNCNAAEFVGRVPRTRASPEEADGGVGPRSRGTAPRFILDTAAAYLSDIGRFRLPTSFLHAFLLRGEADPFAPRAACSPQSSRSPVSRSPPAQSTAISRSRSRSRTTARSNSVRSASPLCSLIPQRLGRIQMRRPVGGQNPENQPHQAGNPERHHNRHQ